MIRQIQKKSRKQKQNQYYEFNGKFYDKMKSRIQFFSINVNQKSFIQFSNFLSHENTNHYRSTTAIYFTTLNWVTNIYFKNLNIFKRIFGYRLSQRINYEFQYIHIIFSLNFLLSAKEFENLLFIIKMKSVITGAASLAALNNPDAQKTLATSTQFGSLSGSTSSSSITPGSGATLSATSLLNGALSGSGSGLNSFSSKDGSFGIGSANGASGLSSGISSGSNSGSFGFGNIGSLLGGLSGSGSSSSLGTFTSNNGYTISKNALSSGSNSNFGTLSGLSGFSNYGTGTVSPNYVSGAGTYNTLGGLNAYGTLAGSMGGLASGLNGVQTNTYSFPSTNLNSLNGYTVSNGRFTQGDTANTYGVQLTPISNANSFRVINEVQQTLVTPTRSLDSIFIRFPQISQIDKLIATADTSALLRTIQVIGTDSSVTCSQRITYLLELLGRLRAAIEKKSYTFDQLKVVISTSVGEIQRLQAQIESTKKLVAGLGIADLKDKHAKQNAILQEAYKKSNNVDGQIPVLQARLKGFENEVQILTRSSQGQRNKVSNDKLKLVDIVNEISNLQSKLKQLQDKEVSLNTSITKSTRKVAQNDANIEKLRIKVSQIQSDISKIKDDVDRSKTQTKDLDVKVQRIRTDISVAQAKKQKFLNQIAALDDKINVEKTKAVDDDLNRLNEVILSLRNLIPNVESAIDRNYYNCYGEGENVKIEQSGNVSVYIVSGDHFRDYLQNIYGISPAMLPSVTKDVAFNKVDIFGPDWAGRFGYPFNDSAFNSPDFSFSGSFNCLNPASMVTGSSVITGIGSNFIEAQDDQGNILRFNLGSCSRLESTLRVPNVGQKFFYSGVPGNQGLNLYGGTCFE